MSAECDSDLVLASQDFKKLEATHLKVSHVRMEEAFIL